MEATLSEEESARARKVLVVDDAGDVRDLMTVLIKTRFNCLVENASCIEDARQCLTETDFDLVVCDFEIGRETGADLIEHLIKRRIELPFFLYTGHREIQARDFDHLDYPLVVIHKPHHNALLTVISEVMTWPLRGQESAEGFGNKKD